MTAFAEAAAGADQRSFGNSGSSLVEALAAAAAAAVAAGRSQSAQIGSWAVEPEFERAQTAGHRSYAADTTVDRQVKIAAVPLFQTKDA